MSALALHKLDINKLMTEFILKNDSRYVVFGKMRARPNCTYIFYCWGGNTIEAY